MSNPIIEKIKKLLRLGRCSGATAAEAAAAMNKAIALAAQHGIDLSQVPTEDPSRGGTTHTTEPSQAGPAHVLASNLVKRHFSVSTLFDSTGPKPVIHFIGLDTNCQLAQYCYVYLVRSSRAAWRNRSNKRLRDRDSFLRGYFGAINQVMPAIFHREGLIFSADDYVQSVILAGRTGVTLGSVRSRSKPGKISESAFHHGFMAGQQGGIREGIRGTEQPLIG